MDAVKIRYRLKNHPTSIKKIGRTIAMTGIGLFLLGDLVISPVLATIPLELWIVAFEDVIPRALGNFWMVGLFVFFGGFSLETFNWRTGTLSLDNKLNEIRISGLFNCNVKLSELTAVEVFNLRVGLKRSVRFLWLNEKLTVKFYDEATLIHFIEMLTPKVSEHSNVNIGTWAD
ncbi:MAG: hypothetical protein RIE86_23085 [Imperialibacter sp.]|uniref:hypothetical protein n=1 Tax=Imperialibacter sp. TaxID=2038411 RepID=UPI0032EEC0FC